MTVASQLKLQTVTGESDALRALPADYLTAIEGG